jgi:hypothetical protein
MSCRFAAKKQLEMWGRAAAEYGLSPTEVAMGLKLGIRWRRLEEKKHKAESNKLR